MKNKKNISFHAFYSSCNQFYKIQIEILLTLIFFTQLVNFYKKREIESTKVFKYI